NWKDSATDTLPALDETAKIAAGNGVPNFLESSASSRLASEIGTDRPAVGGQVLPKARWNAASLLTSAQNDTLPVPRWIYVNREGTAPLTGANASGNEAKSVLGSALNPGFVIGRYAYRIYDISGLVDLNVAGFAAQARDTERVGRKGSLAWLDFFRNPDLGFTPSAGDDGFLSWRGPTTKLADYVDKFGQKNGFLRTPASLSGTRVNRILSRSDLVQLVSSKRFAAEFGNPEEFLTQVTAFNRDVNAPAFAPPVPPTASPVALNPAIQTVRVGKAFTRRDGTTAKVGDALVSQRFPLSEIAVLATKNPGPDQLAEIRDYFGLVPASGGKWNYVAGTKMDSGFGDGPRERLETLDEIAQEGREPNFFEMLQAGIQADSLGQGAEDAFFANSVTDRNIARHVLQIGLNIIDQYDEDDDPTVIARTSFETLKQYADSPDPDLAGIENLPYIQMIGHNYFRRNIYEPIGTADYPVSDYPLLTCFYQFQLWNPHRNASSLANSKFRIVADGTVRVRVRNVDNAGTNYGNDLTGPPIVYSPEDTRLEFSSDSDAAKFTTPKLLEPKMPGVSVTAPDKNSYEVQRANIIGFWQGDCPAPYHGFSKNPSAPGTPLEQRSHYERYGTISGATVVEPDAPASAQFQSSPYTDTPDVGGSKGVSFQLQKFDGTNWRPVQTIPSLTNQGASEMAVTHNPLGGGGTTWDYSGRTHNTPGAINKHWVLHDPRTIRFGLFHSSLADQRGVVDAPFPSTGQWYFSGWLQENRGIPAATGSTVLYQIPVAYKNQSSTTAYYRDRGGAAKAGVVRPADEPASNPYLSPETRPIVLNRPFKTVAEIGYAFRDLPWKTENFSRDLDGNNVALSADSALLDLMSLTETPVREGAINLNAASDETLTALLSQTDVGNGISFTSADVTSLVAGIRGYLGTRQNPLHALRSNADLSLLLRSLPVISGWPKPKREAVAVALADIVNTRTWNVLIDVVVQTGRLADGGDHSLAGFAVAGQRHLLVQVAIDRTTGGIVDQLVEDA
ncbi:MAG TPA: hypothetical protein VNB29_10830, partial [Chthoniobacterales bacterium]|nr:hypothetical protein [Chthoniobacterales bacterium]